MKKAIITKTLLAALMLLAPLAANAQRVDSTCQRVLFETTMGNITIALYNETPRHRDNMIKLVKEGFYDGLLFHRVIAKFVVQAGDPASRNAEPGQLLGDSPEPYKIPCEVRKNIHHKMGSVAAAREGDDVNPDRESSASQFYICCRSSAPHLDGDYTVFGEVVDGMGIVKDMQWVETDGNDRPVKDVRITKATVLE